MSEIRKMSGNVEDIALARKREKITTQPFHELYNSRGYRIWAQNIEAEIRYLEELSWTANPDPATSDEAKVLKKMGLQSPKSPSEQFEVFKACRAAVRYMKTNLEYIEKQARRHDQLIAQEVAEEKPNG